MNFINKKELAKVVFVTGATRSGKIILNRILSSLNNIENIRYDPLTEQFPCLHRLKKIDDETCVYLFKYSVYHMIYDNYLGRNSNFRPSDFTSIWKTPDPHKFIYRLASFKPHGYGDSLQGDDAITSIVDSKIIFQMMLHFQLMHINILFKSFPNALVYYMKKHPIDLTYSWLKKSYGGLFYENPRVAMMLFKHGKHTIPYYAVGWEDVFITLNNTDKIIYMINHMNNVSEDEYFKLNENFKNKLKPIDFDNLVQNPEEHVKQICRDLNTKETPYLNTIYNEENLPRNIKIGQRDIKLKHIKETASKEGLELLFKMIEKFESPESI
tara:strand:- start:86 stop:1063 length:978 start_codon:yes stop_codon:yes gene_type:complete